MRYFIFLLLIFVASCATKVGRVDSDSVTDLSGRWNDTDSRIVAQELIPDMLSAGWLARYTADNNEPPVVLIGTVKNNSSEHIPVETFTKAIEKAMVNSGRIDIVAGGDQRAELRAELEDQQSFASAETRGELAQATGANFLLQGTISSITDARDGTRAVYYQIDLELVNIQSNRKSWIGSTEIKKLIERSKSGW